MSVHLYLLALQSIHRIASKSGVGPNFPGFFSLYWSPPSEFANALQKIVPILDEFMKRYGITWWDIYLESNS